MLGFHITTVIRAGFPLFYKIQNVDFIHGGAINGIVRDFHTGSRTSPLGITNHASSFKNDCSGLFLKRSRFTDI